MGKIIVYCGKSIESKCGLQLHPLTQVEKAIEALDKAKESDENLIFFSTSTDFVSAIKHIGKVQKVKTQFYLNGKNCKNNLEPIFKDFNRSLDLISKSCPIE